MFVFIWQKEKKTIFSYGKNWKRFSPDPVAAALQSCTVGRRRPNKKVTLSSARKRCVCPPVARVLSHSPAVTISHRRSPPPSPITPGQRRLTLGRRRQRPPRDTTIFTLAWTVVWDASTFGFAVIGGKKRFGFCIFFDHCTRVLFDFSIRFCWIFFFFSFQIFSAP